MFIFMKSSRDHGGAFKGLFLFGLDDRSVGWDA